MLEETTGCGYPRRSDMADAIIVECSAWTGTPWLTPQDIVDDLARYGSEPIEDSDIRAWLRYPLRPRYARRPSVRAATRRAVRMSRP